jgi:hypothetical protein
MPGGFSKYFTRKILEDDSIKMMEKSESALTGGQYREKNYLVS